MVFGFFAVIGIGHIASFASQSHGDGRYQRNTFVSRAEQHVEVDVLGQQCIGIAVGDSRHAAAVADQAQVKEVGANAARFELEFTEFEYFTVKRELQEVLLMAEHN